MVCKRFSGASKPSATFPECSVFGVYGVFSVLGFFGFLAFSAFLGFSAFSPRRLLHQSA